MHTKIQRENTMEEVEISLSEIIQALKKRWLLVVLPPIILGLLAGIYTHNLPKQYESSGIIRVGYVGSDPVESIAGTAVIMKSDQLRRQIADNMGKANDEDYIESLLDTVNYTDSAGMLEVSAKAENAVSAQKLASVASSIILQRQKNAYESEKKNLAQLVAYVKENIRPIPLSSGIREFRLSESSVVVSANLPKQPIEIKQQYAIFFFSLGLILMILIVVFLERKTIIRKVQL
jgi:capsular polysaccharide biosynthesis protein